MAYLQDVMNRVRAKVLTEAEGVLNHHEQPLVNNSTFAAGIEMLTPGTELSQDIQSPGEAVAIGRLLSSVVEGIQVEKETE